jgi:hypothetical protein
VRFSCAASMPPAYPISYKTETKAALGSASQSCNQLLVCPASTSLGVHPIGSARLNCAALPPSPVAISAPQSCRCHAPSCCRRVALLPSAAVISISLVCAMHPVRAHNVGDAREALDPAARTVDPTDMENDGYCGRAWNTIYPKLSGCVHRPAPYRCRKRVMAWHGGGRSVGASQRQHWRTDRSGGRHRPHVHASRCCPDELGSPAVGAGAYCPALHGAALASYRETSQLPSCWLTELVAVLAWTQTSQPCTPPLHRRC